MHTVTDQAPLTALRFLDYLEPDDVEVLKALGRLSLNAASSTRLQLLEMIEDFADNFGFALCSESRDYLIRHYRRLGFSIPYDQAICLCEWRVADTSIDLAA